MSERLFNHPRFDGIPDELVKYKARTSFLDYICAVDSEFVVNWHHVLICDKLDRVARRELFRMMVFMPPRHSKSRMISQLFPAYYLGINNDLRVRGITTDQDLAEINNKACQLVMDTDQHRAIFPNAVLPTGKVSVGGGRTNKTRRVGTFDLLEGAGGYSCKGVGGNIMGRGYHLGLIDDIYSSFSEAVNQVFREKVQNWYSTDFYTRRMPNAAIVFLITRWHHQDLPGVLTAKPNHGWDIVSLPAISGEIREAYDERTSAGQALWPEMYPLDFLLDVKENNMPPFWWDSLYQQKPQKEGGNVFSRKNFGRFYIEGIHVFVNRKNGRVDKYLLEQCRYFMTVDPASSEAKTADYTAHCVSMITPNNDHCLLEVDQKRVNVTEFSGHIKKIVNRFVPSFIVMEATGAHKALVQDCRETVGMPPIRTVEPYAKDSKFVRAHPAILKSDDGKVFVPTQSDWEDAFFDQIEGFTGHPDDSGHDDMVDAFAYAVLHSPTISFADRYELQYDPNDIMARLRPTEQLRYRL